MLLLKDARRRRFDAVVVWRLDRLGRSLRHLILTLDELSALGVAFVSLGEGIDTSTPAGRLQLHILGAIAEFERARIEERVRLGLARAKAQGRRLGRPRRRVTDAEFAATAGLSARLAAIELGCPRASWLSGGCPETSVRRGAIPPRIRPEGAAARSVQKAPIVDSPAKVGTTASAQPVRATAERRPSNELCGRRQTPSHRIIDTSAAAVGVTKSVAATQRPSERPTCGAPRANPGLPPPAPRG